MESSHYCRRNRNTGDVEGELAGSIDDRDTGPEEGPILKVWWINLEWPTRSLEPLSILRCLFVQFHDLKEWNGIPVCLWGLSRCLDGLMGLRNSLADMREENKTICCVDSYDSRLVLLLGQFNSMILLLFQDVVVAIMKLLVTLPAARPQIPWWQT